MSERVARLTLIGLLSSQTLTQFHFLIGSVVGPIQLYTLSLKKQPSCMLTHVRQ